MRIFSISGFSGTGKTSLIESIVREMVDRGHKVSTVKSSQHEPRDGQETDTERHKLAGAITSYFIGPSEKERSLKDIVDSQEVDYLIVEGMKSSTIPKVWCIGNSSLGDTIPVEVKAIISWDPEMVQDKYGIPILASDDINQIVSIILEDAIELSQLKV